MRKWVIGTSVGLVVLLVVVSGAYTLSKSRTYQLAGEIVNRVDTAEKVVAVTFDDGPTEYASEVLNMLAAKKIPATFYLVGADLDRNPDEGAAIARAGHEIGNHTYTHRRMIFVSTQTVADEIERTDAAIARTGYRGPVTFRPPYGKKLWTLPHYLAEHGRTTVTWDLEPDSAGAPTTEQIVAETVDNVRPGSIILLHVMLKSGSASRAAVPLIIDRLHSEGYRFLTVSELLAVNDGVPDR
ncbi:polysaccharide deacetylase family protein [Mycobacterium sp. CVI_P3]|uniref:Polysaccharide deacetylase family protein n=1 Tax=Mycobacterium pinniadriaticum TaxID=2994102 RepID=A0ABT3S9X0_9MYCO|nr:polysaccharide deacetylase family protein [Mycobacterium pinniadriaticum]MCX2929499.1 polysaccharide deacetylase family protein [Mycobacterium pinniadriaticum]MCX2935923.1 polysaccharide deacetylase family protein [Mycobacterium pinniadriaticum]